MIPLRQIAPLPLLASLILTGCAASGTFPTLARRPQEQVEGRIAGTVAVPVVALPTAAPTDPAAVATLNDLREQAETAHERFTAQRNRDGRAIRAGRNSAPGSDSWAVAAVATADLIGEHDATVAALAEIDGLYVRQQVDGGDGGAITAVRDQVTAWVADEDAVLAELVGR